MAGDSGGRAALSLCRLDRHSRASWIPQTSVRIKFKAGGTKNTVLVSQMGGGTESDAFWTKAARAKTLNAAVTTTANDNRSSSRDLRGFNPQEIGMRYSGKTMYV